jgi:DNA-binding IclR family transcriptional regulator
MPRHTERPSGILVLHKAMDILETVRNSRSGLGLAELSRALGLPKPTAYRIVVTLESRGLLSRNPEGHYQISRRLFEPQSGRADEQTLVRVAQPVMDRLVQFCRETVNLGMLDAGEVVVISTVESPQAIRMSSKIGNRRYMHSTALGKVMLAGLPEKEVLRLVRLHGMPRLTPHTVVSKPGLSAELDLVRRQGYSMDNEENEPGGRCIGAPITEPGGRIVAAMSISAPVFRMDAASIRKFVPALTEACREISQAIASV